MKAPIQDTKVLNTLRPLDILAYLRSNQWQEAQKLERGAFWTKESSDLSHEILVPFDSNIRDFANRMAELLTVLEIAENRSQFEIYEDLMTTNADVIRPRLPGVNADGAITLEQGMKIHQEARNMMLAAACSTIEKRPLFAKRKPEQAMNYLEHALFGIPQRGSYLMKIISPVSPKIAGSKDLFGNDLEPDEPFGRRTVKTLADSLNAVEMACREIASTGDIEPMKRAVTRGVSANLCEAIIGLHVGSGEKGISFTFSWAPIRGIPRDTISKAFISPDSIPILEETVRIFQETETIESSEIIGTVNKLEHEGERQGKVTVFGSADGVSRSVVMELTATDHEMAIRSYRERIPITCLGELTKEGRSWVLKNPRDLRLLTEQ
jgi:hypothetical protein